MAARLREHALPSVDEDDGDIGGGGAGGHVAGVLLVAGGVGNDELAPRGGDVAVGNVDGDAPLALGAETIGKEGEIKDAGAGASLAFDRADLIFVDAAGVVEETADEGRLAIVDGAGSGEAEEVFRALGSEEGFDLEGGISHFSGECGRERDGLRFGAV